MVYDTKPSRWSCKGSITLDARAITLDTSKYDVAAKTARVQPFNPASRSSCVAVSGRLLAGGDCLRSGLGTVASRLAIRLLSWAISVLISSALLTDPSVSPVTALPMWCVEEGRGSSEVDAGVASRWLREPGEEEAAVQT